MASSFKRLAPLLNRVLIKKVEVVNKSPAGIILQDTASQENVGEVVEVGPGQFDNNGKVIPVIVKAGDKVLLPDYGGTKVKLNNGEYWLYRDSDILGILHKD
jgi:Co-chaperonin GroES (HSP10)